MEQEQKAESRNDHVAMRITKRRTRSKWRTLSTIPLACLVVLVLAAYSSSGVDNEVIAIAATEHDEATTAGCETRAPSSNSTKPACYKMVTYTGGFGNRLGPILCALGLTHSKKSAAPLHILWNAANEGVPGDRKPPTTRDTRRQGYNLSDILQAVNLPFEFIPTPPSRPNCPNRISTNLTFYPHDMANGVREWKKFYRDIDATVVDDYELREQAFQELDCYNIPTFQGKSKLNGYTPEPCYAKYNVYAKTDPDFAYLAPLLLEGLSKDDYVTSLIRATHLIAPKLDFCLPKEPYLVIHARRGDRWPVSPRDVANATPIMRDVLVKLQPLNLLILSDNPFEREILVQESQRHNLKVVEPTCTAQDLVDRHSQGGSASSILYHAPTIAVLQDYFAMSRAAGIISDFMRSESSFSTTAALGNGIPLLYFGNRTGHSFKRVEDRGGGRMRNVYYLDHLESYIEAVRLKAKEMK